MSGYREPDRPRDIDAELLAVYEADVARDKARAETLRMRVTYALAAVVLALLLATFGFAGWQAWKAADYSGALTIVVMFLAMVAGVVASARSARSEDQEAALYEKAAAIPDAPPKVVATRLRIAEAAPTAGEPLDEADADAPEAAKRAR